MNEERPYEGVKIPTKALKQILNDHQIYMETSGSNGKEAKLQGCVLKNAQLIQMDFSGLNLSEVDFTNAVLNGSDFTGADLSNAVFNRAKLKSTVFTDACLINADLTGADLTLAGLNRANLTNANLLGVSYSRALIRGAIFVNAKLDKQFEEYIVKNGSVPSVTPVIQKNNISSDDPDESNDGIYSNECEDYVVRNRTISPCFDVQTVARVFCSHILNLQEESGQMIGIFGHWGRGKTYFAEKVLNNILQDNDRKFIVIRFQPWKYQDTPGVWAYLYETIFEEFKKEKWWVKLQLTWKRLEKTKIWMFIALILLLGLFLSFGVTIPGLEVETLIKLFGGVSIGTIFYRLWKTVENYHNTASGLLKKYMKNISFCNVLGIQAEIEKELIRLLAAWIPDPSKKRIVLFVDDLDRCSQGKIVELVDSLRVMLDNTEIRKKLIIICACDDSKIKMALRFKYKDYCSEYVEEKNIITEYLDKLFISGIKLSEINETDISEFIDKLMESDKQSENMVQEHIFTSSKKESNYLMRQVEVLLKKMGHIFKKQEEKVAEAEVVGVANDVPTVNEVKEIGLSRKDLNELIKKQVNLFGSGLTPRQICIFYYRYRLGQNLYLALTKQRLMNNEELLASIRKKSCGEPMDEITDEYLKLVVNMVVSYTCEDKSLLNDSVSPS